MSHRYRRRCSQRGILLSDPHPSPFHHHYHPSLHPRDRPHLHPPPRTRHSSLNNRDHWRLQKIKKYQGSRLLRRQKLEPGKKGERVQTWAICSMSHLCRDRSRWRLPAVVEGVGREGEEVVAVGAEVVVVEGRPLRPLLVGVRVGREEELETRMEKECHH